MPGMKKYAPPHDGYKIWNAGEALPYRFRLNGKRAAVGIMDAWDWIGVVIETIEMRVVYPRMLNEFKLA